MLNIIFWAVFGPVALILVCVVWLCLVVGVATSLRRRR